MRVSGNELRRFDRMGCRTRMLAGVFGAACALAGAVLLQSPRIAAASQAIGQSGTLTVWSGVYTNEQAARGRASYAKECASCHAENLQGGDEAPGLVGEGFLAPWTGLSVGELFERIRATMPQDRPGQLSRAANADIVAYLLRMNKFPAGSRELGSDAATLKQIAIAPRSAN